MSAADRREVARCSTSWRRAGRVGRLNTCPQNITGSPALSVPAGRLPNGLPFGLQFTGPRYRDDLLLALGARWEEARPWPWYAPGFEPLVDQPAAP